MKKLFFLVLFSTILLFSCQTEEINESTIAPSQNENVTYRSREEEPKKGLIRIKLKKSIGDNIIISNSQGAIRSNVSQIDNYLHNIESSSMKRVFPHAGEFEERTRKAGLHLWYDVSFKESNSVRRAMTEAKEMPEVEIVEEVYEAVRPKHKKLSLNSLFRSTTNLPFNDPGLRTQWHYKNTGAFPKSIVGADINLFNAWETETGKKNVIVCVVDGGIDVEHEDLKESMLSNLSYNFVRDTTAIDVDDHGTHVAGTVAARNNNGIGVCGVAGGDGSPDSGVRLISCQIFEGEEKSAGMAAAIKYGADNGAVISQNSWSQGGNTMRESTAEAIDYFIKFAGCDNDGNQKPDSPMKGGVVIFAAGNENKEKLAYPAAYPPVISVSAMTADFKKTWYTNRGDWISIMAPGGDRNYPQGMIVSTVPGNEYGAMEGTSMACPHVSGVAALVVSKFGGPDFTNEELKQRLLTSLLSVDIDEKNPKFKGRLGKGYIDAAKALAVNENKKPDDIKRFDKTEDFNAIELIWDAVNDEDDITADNYKLYYSSKEVLTEANYKNAELININGHMYKPGDHISYKMQLLSLNTNYHFALTAEDRWGLQSRPVFLSAKTKENFPPELTTSITEKIKITAAEKATIKIMVNEPEGQDWTFTLDGEQRGVSAIKGENVITLTIRAIAPKGKHKLSVRVADIFDAAKTIEIPFETYQNRPPKLSKNISEILIPIGKKDYSINLSEYFTDEDEQRLSYEAYSFNPSSCEVKVENDKLTIIPHRIGQTQVEIIAEDTQGAKVKGIAKVMIVKEELVYMLYPIPATNVLNIRLSNEVETATISVYTSKGNLALRKEIKASSPETRMIALDISKLSPGTFTLQVESNNKLFKKSFIKR